MNRQRTPGKLSAVPIVFDGRKSLSHCILPLAVPSTNVCRMNLLMKHRGIAERLLVEHQKHCAEMAATCMVKFQGVLSWLQRKPKDIEEVTAHTLYFGSSLSTRGVGCFSTATQCILHGAVPSSASTLKNRCPPCSYPMSKLHLGLPRRQWHRNVCFVGSRSCGWAPLPPTVPLIDSNSSLLSNLIALSYSKAHRRLAV